MGIWSHSKRLDIVSHQNKSRGLRRDPSLTVKKFESHSGGTGHPKESQENETGVLICPCTRTRKSQW